MFSKKTKIAAALYQGVDLFGKHADHIVPKSKGGSDDVSNCQILEASLNIRKSNKMIPELREWQKEFRRYWLESKAQSFLIKAIPATGKTIAALTVAKEWRRAVNNRCPRPKESTDQERIEYLVNFLAKGSGSRVAVDKALAELQKLTAK